METEKARVQRGAAILDRLVPFWYKRIDLGRLDLSGCSNCIIGHLFESYTAGSQALCRGADYEYGFDVPLIYELDARMMAYQKLQRYWIEEINLRLKGGDTQESSLVVQERELVSV